MDEIDEFFASLPKGRCHPCEYAKCIVANSQWMFLGCCHEPYHGKWVKEIEHCPKEKNEG